MTVYLNPIINCTFSNIYKQNYHIFIKMESRKLIQVLQIYFAVTLFGSQGTWNQNAIVTSVVLRERPQVLYIFGNRKK